MFTCNLCGTTIPQNIAHECPAMYNPPPSTDMIALMNRLEYLARENEKLRIRLDVLTAKKEMNK